MTSLCLVCAASSDQLLYSSHHCLGKVINAILLSNGLNHVGSVIALCYSEIFVSSSRVGTVSG